LHNAEQGRTRPDAQRQSQNRHESEGGVFVQRTEGVT
jgi:hypothetical protein